MNSMYTDGDYLDKNPDWHAEDAPYKAKWIASILRNNRIAPLSISEVGCGSGEVLINVGKLYPKATLSGFDISPQAYGICEPKSDKRTRFFLQDIAETNEPTFDVLLSIDVFEHVEDYIGFVRKIRDKAIYKVFHIPLDLSVQTLLRSKPIMHARAEVGHINYFYKDTALETLKSAGYEIMDYRYTHFSQELPNRPLGMRLLNAPRKIAQMVSEDLSVRLFGGSSLLVLAK